MQLTACRTSPVQAAHARSLKQHHARCWAYGSSSGSQRLTALDQQLRELWASSSPPDVGGVTHLVQSAAAELQASHDWQALQMSMRMLVVQCNAAAGATLRWPGITQLAVLGLGSLCKPGTCTIHLGSCYSRDQVSIQCNTDNACYPTLQVYLPPPAGVLHYNCGSLPWPWQCVSCSQA
jgi:hypothetical protein